MITMQNLHKSYGKVVALCGLGFDAADGQITTLLGANGSGKTTTLRAIGGLLRADAGTVLIDGADVFRQPRIARAALGFLPDRFGHYPRLSAREHVEFFGRLKGLHGRSLADAVDAAIDLLAMHDIADRRTAGFSHGQRVKVALAQTLIGSPRNLVLDEPTRGLDVFSVRLLRRVLRQLRDQGCCVLLSSHAMAEVEALSDRIVVIAGGKAVAADSAAGLMQATGAADLEDAFVALTEQHGGRRHVA